MVAQALESHYKSPPSSPSSAHRLVSIRIDAIVPDQSVPPEPEEEESEQPKTTEHCLQGGEREGRPDQAAPGLPGLASASAQEAAQGSAALSTTDCMHQAAQTSNEGQLQPQEPGELVSCRLLANLPTGPEDAGLSMQRASSAEPLAGSSSSRARQAPDTWADIGEPGAQGTGTAATHNNTTTDALVADAAEHGAEQAVDVLTSCDTAVSRDTTWVECEAQQPVRAGKYCDTGNTNTACTASPAGCTEDAQSLSGMSPITAPQHPNRHTERANDGCSSQAGQKRACSGGTVTSSSSEVWPARHITSSAGCATREGRIMEIAVDATGGAIMTVELPASVKEQ